MYPNDESIYVQLEMQLVNCPQPWQRFVKYYNPDGDTVLAVNRALAEYNSYMTDPEKRECAVVFPNKEEYARFILTWS